MCSKIIKSSRNKSIWKWNKTPRKYDIEVASLRKNHKEFIKNIRIILRSQQIFKRKKYNASTEEVYKIALSAYSDNIIQSVDSM